MSAVRATVDLPASPEDVWDLIMDPHRLESGVPPIDGPPRPGLRMTQRMAIRGAPVTVTWTLDEVDAPRTARWTGAGPAGSTAFIEYRLEPRDGGTRFHYTNDFRPPMGLLGKVASRALMGGTPDREAEASLQRLRTLFASG
jgi:uncharacterized protein YndB with AHSA1/START domain